MNEIDLHGMYADDAKKYLNDQISRLPKGTLSVDVIHGYNQGTALKKMVMAFKHERIERKIIGLNQGVTTFILKKDR